MPCQALPIMPRTPHALSPAGRGLHSFTSQLNLSDVYGIGDARRVV